MLTKKKTKKTDVAANLIQNVLHGGLQLACQALGVRWRESGPPRINLTLMDGDVSLIYKSGRINRNMNRKYEHVNVRINLNLALVNDDVSLIYINHGE